MSVVLQTMVSNLIITHMDLSVASLTHIFFLTTMSLMQKLITFLSSRITSMLDKHTSRIFDTSEGKLKNFPKSILWLVYIMSVNVLIQGIFDIVIKFGGYTPWVVTFPWRMDFLFLTAISVLMGYQTLIGMRRRELDVTRNSVQVGLLVEIALFVGDIWFVIEHRIDIPAALPIRLPFIVFTFLNILILAHLVVRLRLFKNEQGAWQFF